MSQTGGNKATLSSLDDGRSFEVQFNPKEFQVSKSLTWAESEEQGQDQNSVQFQKGAPMSASFDLYFDTTGESSTTSVHTSWVGPLLSLTKSEVTPGEGEAKELDKQRPRAFRFTWGDFELQCVIESLTVTYLMFASDGTAVRARASVKLKEWMQPEFATEAGGFRWETSAVKLIEVSGGQTLSQVASSNNVDMRQLAADNGLTDPLEDITGLTLTCRG